MNVAYKDIVPGSVVLLGNFYKDKKSLSGATAFVVGKDVLKIGNNVYSRIRIETEAGMNEVQLHNVAAILA